MGKNEESKNKSIHIKNVGGGVAVNITIELKNLDTNKDGNPKTFHRTVMTGEGDSHNTKIELSEDMHFAIKYSYEDIIGNLNKYSEEYQYVHRSKQLTRILRTK